MTYSNLRANLKEAFDSACEEDKPIHIKRQRGKDVVIVSMKNWKAIEETLYLIKSPANAKRLIEAMNDQAQNIKTSLKDLYSEFGITPFLS